MTEALVKCVADTIKKLDERDWNYFSAAMRRI